VPSHPTHLSRCMQSWGIWGRGCQVLRLQLPLSWGTSSPLTHVYAFQGIMLAGDGYRGKTSPHTPNERFEGATVLKALKVQLPPPPPPPCPSSQPMHSTDPLLPPFLVQYGYEGRVPLKSARLFYDISEKARRIVESYFMLNSTLYFSYTHLVCRTALSGEGLGAGGRAGLGGQKGFSSPQRVLRVGDPSLRVSLVCLMLKLAANGLAKSPSPQQQKVGTAVLKKLLSGMSLGFHVSSSSSFLLPLLLPPLTVPSPFHPTPSSPSGFPAVRTKQSCAYLSPRCHVAFSPQPFLCSFHP